MSFRLVPQSVTRTMNGLMAVTLCYCTQVGKHVFQHITTSIYARFMHESIVFCTACTMSS